MTKDMQIHGVYVKGIHKDAFRPGCSGKVVGLVYVEHPSVSTPVLCLDVLYDDGVQKFVPYGLVCEGAYVLSSSEID
jgi:hypothetical protein